MLGLTCVVVVTVFGVDESVMEECGVVGNA